LRKLRAGRAAGQAERFGRVGRLDRARLALALAGGIAPETAEAGAWLLPEGRTQIIFGGTALTATRRFDSRGHALGTGRFSKQEGGAFAEHGLSEVVTLIAAAGFTASSTTGSAGRERIGAGSISAGARARLWSDGASVLSLQGFATASGERGLTGPARRLDAPAEAEARLLYGYGFALAEIPAFAEAQAGWRWRGGRRADEFRFDAAIGVRPWPRLLVMLQSFNAMAVGPDRHDGVGRLRRHKLQPSLTFDIDENWSVQLGVFASIGGRETIQERGLVAAVWRRF
jgi:hypothetical protein